MRKLWKPYIILSAIIAIIVISIIILKASPIWENNSYRITGGDHLTLSAGDKSLFWFDVEHTNNPHNIMFKDLEKELIEFSPDLVLVEGYSAALNYASRDQAILDGESIFGTYLANQNGIPVEDIEPSEPELLEYLQSKYSSDEILAMYLVRQIASEAFMEVNTVNDLDNYLTGMTVHLVENGLDYKETDIESIYNTINAYLKKPLDENNWKDRAKELYRVYFNEDGALNIVYEDTSDFRNIYLVQLIKEKKEQYNRIFVIMGGGHIPMTIEELKKIYSVLPQ